MGQTSGNRDTRCHTSSEVSAWVSIKFRKPQVGRAYAHVRLQGGRSSRCLHEPFSLDALQAFETHMRTAQFPHAHRPVPTQPIHTTSNRQHVKAGAEVSCVATQEVGEGTCGAAATHCLFNSARPLSPKVADSGKSNPSAWLSLSRAAPWMRAAFCRRFSSCASLFCVLLFCV